MRTGAEAPIPFAELVSVTETSLALARQLAGDDAVAPSDDADDATQDDAVVHELRARNGVAHDSAGGSDWPSAAGEGAS